jgi:hypothetical protein
MVDLSKLVDDLSRLTVLEAAELARLLEEKWQSTQARQSKVSFAAIKNDLPAWPDEVIKEWLLYLANRDDTGWPPPDPLRYHAWAFILGHRPLRWWREVTWKLQFTDCSFASLAPATQAIVTCTLGEITNRTADEGTKRRYDNIPSHPEQRCIRRTPNCRETCRRPQYSGRQPPDHCVLRSANDTTRRLRTTRLKKTRAGTRCVDRNAQPRRDAAGLSARP